MTNAAAKLVVGLLIFIAMGAYLGWLYDRTLWGLLTAITLALAWQVRQLLSFDRALRTGNFDNFRIGEGVWEQMFSKFKYESERAVRHKVNYRRLLKEIRKSTDAMPDGAVILDENLQIVVANRAAKKLIGIKRHKDKGRRIDNILRDPDIAKLVNDVLFDRIVEIPSPVSDSRWLGCRVVPYGAGQKLLLIRDISQRVQLSKMRRDFVANASHELRSPLTVVSGYLDALADDESMPPSWAKPVEQMRSQSLRMNRILSELLELSRLESSGSAGTEESIDMARLLDTVCVDFKGRAVAASVVVNNESNVELLGVRIEIESVVTNLLRNALRHTPSEGQVTLTWRSNSDGAELIVADTGEGVEPELIPRLTERFFRIDRGRGRDAGGVGLGLAIVKHVLARHDAKLLISSEPGVGSQFCCRFPVERMTAPYPGELS